MPASLSLATVFVFTAALVAPDIAAAAGAGSPTPPAQTTQPTQNKKAHTKKPKGTMQKSGSGIFRQEIGNGIGVGPKRPHPERAQLEQSCRQNGFMHDLA
jgi:hypothetical protein